MTDYAILSIGINKSDDASSRDIYYKVLGAYRGERLDHDDVIALMVDVDRLGEALRIPDISTGDIRVKWIDTECLDYQRIYDARESINWCEISMFGLRVEWHIEARYGEILRRLVSRRYLKFYPRRHKVNDKIIMKFEEEHPEEVKPIRDRLMVSAIAYFKQRIFQFEIMGELLRHLSQTVDIIESGNMRKVKGVHPSTYSSQGWGADKYAKQSLTGLQGVLDRAGYANEIIRDDKSGEYQLLARLESWQIDALTRRDSITEMDWARECWRNGVNPKVYNPFLDDDIFDKSMRTYNQEVK